jgi:hypothetical protein
MPHPDDVNVTEAQVQRLLDKARAEREKNAANEEGDG